MGTDEQEPGASLLSPLEGQVLAMRVGIDPREVARLVGLPEGRAPEGATAAVLGEALVRARRLAAPHGVFRILPPERARDVGLVPAPASALAIGLVTIGGAVEAEAECAMNAGEALLALALEAAGSAAVEEAADLLGAALVGDPGVVVEERTVRPATAQAVPAAPPEGLGGRRQPAACRFSPGYGSWRLEDQALLLARLPCEALGVTLLPSMMMLPRKSISFGMWLGGPQDRAPLGGCAACSFERCRFRRR